MSLTGSSNMSRPTFAGKRAVPGTGGASALHDRGVNATYARDEFRNEQDPKPGNGERREEEETAPGQMPPLFEMADSGLDGDMGLLYRGTGERKLRFMVRRFRRHRGVSALMPVGRTVSASAGEKSPIMRRYREGKELAAVMKGKEFQNRM